MSYCDCNCYHEPEIPVDWREGMAFKMGETWVSLKDLMELHSNLEILQETIRVHENTISNKDKTIKRLKKKCGMKVVDDAK